MPNRILALDPHGAQLVAVVVETSFRSYQVVGFFAEPRDPDAPLAEQLHSFVARHAIAADTVLSALPGRAATYRILELPFRDWRKLAQTVPFELESQVPFAVEEAVIDFQILETDRSRSARLRRAGAARQGRRAPQDPFGSRPRSCGRRLRTAHYAERPPTVRGRAAGPLRIPPREQRAAGHARALSRQTARRPARHRRRGRSGRARRSPARWRGL